MEDRNTHSKNEIDEKDNIETKIDLHTDGILKCRARFDVPNG